MRDAGAAVRLAEHDHMHVTLWFRCKIQVGQNFVQQKNVKAEKAPNHDIRRANHDSCMHAAIAKSGLSTLALYLHSNQLSHFILPHNNSLSTLSLCLLAHRIVLRIAVLRLALVLVRPEPRLLLVSSANTSACVLMYVLSSRAHNHGWRPTPRLRLQRQTDQN